MKKLLLACLVVSFSGCAVGLRIPGLQLGSSSPSSPGEASADEPATLSESQAQKDAAKTWERAVRQNEGAIDTLYRLAGTMPKQGYTGAAASLDEALRLRTNEALAQLAADCQAGTYAGVRVSVYREHQRPSVMCPLLVDREALLKKAIHEGAMEAVQHRVQGQADHVAELETSGKVPVSFLLEGKTVEAMRTYVTSFEKKYFEAIGETVPPEASKGVEEVVASWNAAVLELALKGKVEHAAKADPGAERAIKDVYAKRGFAVQAVLMKDADWKLVKNDLGILLRHYKDADVLVKAKDGRSCAYVPASVGQQYEDAGRYAPRYGVDEFLEAWPVKCP